jgi:hypothetical protein
MGRIRFRLRTLMIVVAFVALVLTVVMQAVLLRRAAVKEELSRALAAQNLAMAELARADAEAQATANLEALKIVQAQAEQALRAAVEKQATPEEPKKERKTGAEPKETQR